MDTGPTRRFDPFAKFYQSETSAALTLGLVAMGLGALAGLILAFLPDEFGNQLSWLLSLLLFVSGSALALFGAMVAQREWDE